jgi:putative FmdB family regulatory protein
MPIFVYECKDCHYQFDLLRHRDKRYKMPSCPACKSRNTTRIVAQPVSLLGRAATPTTIPEAAFPKAAAPTSQTPRLPGGIGVMGGDATLKNVRITGFQTGLGIAEGAKAKASGLIVDDNVVGIDNAGEFEGTDTSIKRHDSPSPPDE